MVVCFWIVSYIYYDRMDIVNDTTENLLCIPRIYIHINLRKIPRSVRTFNHVTIRITKVVGQDERELLPVLRLLRERPRHDTEFHRSDFFEKQVFALARRDRVGI
jgi:hypothetical protein